MEFVDQNLSIQKAEDTVKAISPLASITKIWMGDTWPANEVMRTLLSFEKSRIRSIPMYPNPDADSFIEFSDGHMIVARTYEQGNGNPPPRFGKARRGTGKKGRGAGKRKC